MRIKFSFFFLSFFLQEKLKPKVSTKWEIMKKFSVYKQSTLIGWYGKMKKRGEGGGSDEGWCKSFKNENLLFSPLIISLVLLVGENIVKTTAHRESFKNISIFKVFTWKAATDVELFSSLFHYYAMVNQKLVQQNRYSHGCKE